MKNHQQRHAEMYNQAPTHTHTHTQNDELQWMLVFKQIGMKNYTDHRLAMHSFLGHGSHLFWLVRSRQQYNMEGTNQRQCFGKKKKLFVSL